MDDDARFWKIIEAARQGSDGECDVFSGRVIAALVKLDGDEIAGFQELLNAKLWVTYSHRMWGAAYLINGGCSDDGFEYFRCWLIACGRRTFEAALLEPDSLAEIVDRDEDEQDRECEALLGVAAIAYERVVGEELAYSNAGRPREPTGESWDFDDHKANRRYLPRLTALMG